MKIIGDFRERQVIKWIKFNAPTIRKRKRNKKENKRKRNNKMLLIYLTIPRKIMFFIKLYQKIIRAKWLKWKIFRKSKMIKIIEINKKNLLNKIIYKNNNQQPEFKLNNRINLLKNLKLLKLLLLSLNLLHFSLITHIKKKLNNKKKLQKLKWKVKKTLNIKKVYNKNFQNRK